MASDYVGDSSTFYGTVSLLDDGDKRTALSVRVPIERVIDSTCNLDSRVSSIAGAFISANGGSYTVSVADIQLAGTKKLKSDIIFEFTTNGRCNFDASSGANFAAGSNCNFVGAAANFDSTSSLEMSGALDLLAGSTTTLHDDLNVASGGQINLASSTAIVAASGSNITVSGTQTFASGATLALHDVAQVTVAGESTVFRHSLTPAYVEPASGGGLAYDADTGPWIQTDVSASRMIRFALNAVPGNVITSLQVRLKGNAGAGHAGLLPSTMPAAVLVSTDIDGARTVLETATDTAVAGTGSGQYDSVHAISFSSSMPLTVGTGGRLSVEFFGEAGTNAVADTTAVLSLVGAGTRNKVQATTEFI